MREPPESLNPGPSRSLPGSVMLTPILCVSTAFTPPASHLARVAPLAPDRAVAAALQRLPIAACAFAAVIACTDPAVAVSGGGKDYSGFDLTGQDLGGQTLNGKEFRGTFAKGASFKGSKLRGCSFFKADMSEVDFTGADLSSASLEEAGLFGAKLDGAVLESAYLTKTIADAESIKGADFTEAVMPVPTQKALCAREDAVGKNPTTGADTRESLMCL
jgi:hypothetical protein